MSDLKWSNVLPTKNGWYWIRSEGRNNKMVSYVVNVMAGWVHSVLAIKPVSMKEYDDPEIEWYGPVDSPE